MRGAKPYNDLYLRSLSEKDVSKMTVGEFISLRPVRPTKWMLERYNHLFSVLPEVQRIHQSTKGEDEIARAWSLLRTKMAASEKGLSSTNLRRLTTSINHFLRNRVVPTTFKRVQAVWQTCYTDMIIGKALAKYHEKRSKESMREYWRTTKARSRFKRKEQQPDITLEVLLKKYDISIGDPQEDALNFEERTRFFAGEIRPKHAAVHMLDKYLTSAGCPPQDIIAALGARRHFLKSVRRQTFYERRRERKAMMREEEEEEKTARNAKDHEEVEVDTSASDTLSEEGEDEEEGEEEQEPVPDLLHRVDWWMPSS